jgi:catechol 2,3-dioxygenase-like lactoylglutathione lyase family enzyme
MFDHVGLKVKDLVASTRFYRALLEPLGYEFDSGDASFSGFGPKGAPALWLYQADRSGPGIHLAFSAGSRKAIDRAYAAGIEMGGRDNGKPGVRESYAPNYYAAFLTDPDGNNVEAVCLKD